MSDQSKIEGIVKGLKAQVDILQRAVTSLVNTEDSKNEAITKRLIEQNAYIEELFKNIRQDIHDSIMFVHFRIAELDEKREKQLKDIDLARERGQTEARLFRRLMLIGMLALLVLMLVLGYYIVELVKAYAIQRG